MESDEDKSNDCEDEDDDELNQTAIHPRKILKSVDNESSITTTSSISLNSEVTSLQAATAKKVTQV